MPQGAAVLNIPLGLFRVAHLTCTVETRSPYFRCGIKLLGENGRLFGDTSIQSPDANLVFHIARNDWNRPALKISARDLFFTWYENGIPRQDDKKLFRVNPQISVSLELQIDSSHIASFSVNGRTYLRKPVAPAICCRVALLAWGDGNPYTVRVRNLSVATAPAS